MGGPGAVAKRAAVGVATMLAFSAAPAIAAQHFATPAGSASNWPCSSASSPCDLKTAIQGNGILTPASGDEVIVEAGTYTFTNTKITAPVAEDIHGPGGAVQIDASGVPPGDFLTFGGFSRPTEF